MKEVIKRKMTQEEFLTLLYEGTGESSSLQAFARFFADSLEQMDNVPDYIKRAAGDLWVLSDCLNNRIEELFEHVNEAFNIPQFNVYGERIEG